MITVVFNQKGGVGKSTITVNLAAIAARRGLRTLVVDLDPQANTTRYLLGEAAETAEPTLAEFFDQTLNFKLNPRSTEEFVLPTAHENLALLAGHGALEELQGKLESRYKIFKLREALRELAAQFDRIYIDTPPALNFYTRSALIAARWCLIPYDCDEFARRALLQLLETLEEVRADHNPELQLAGIVVNQFQSRATLPRQAVDELAAQGLPVLSPYLSSSVKVKESHQKSLPLVALELGHRLAQEFAALFEAIEARTAC